MAQEQQPEPRQEAARRRSRAAVRKARRRRATDCPAPASPRRRGRERPRRRCWRRIVRPSIAPPKRMATDQRIVTPASCAVAKAAGVSSAAAGQDERPRRTRAARPKDRDRRHRGRPGGQPRSPRRCAPRRPGRRRPRRTPSADSRLPCSSGEPTSGNGRLKDLRPGEAAEGACAGGGLGRGAGARLRCGWGAWRPR